MNKKIVRNILVTNDDGINAPGRTCLEKIAGQIGENIWIVAPESEQSGTSRSLSLHRPLRIRQCNQRRFAVNGTPADAVIIGANHIMPNKPDILLSGVNYGRNVADDVTYSGTIAAAMEGVNLNIPSFALSQACEFSKKKIYWQTAQYYAPQIIRDLYDYIIQQDDPTQNLLFNINFPHCKPQGVKGIKIVQQGKREQNLFIVNERSDVMGRKYYWIGYKKQDGKPKIKTDMHAIAKCHIAITPLQLNLTEKKSLTKLRTYMKKQA